MKKFRPVCLILVLCLVLAMPFSAMAAEPPHKDHADVDCLACRIVEMISVLPDKEHITVDNAAKVIEQIHAIDRIKFDLTDDAYWTAVDVVVSRYHDAVDAINQLGGGGWVLIGKSIRVNGQPADMDDLSEAQVQFALKKEGSSDAQTLTLSTLNVNSANALSLDEFGNFSASLFGYQANSSEGGWTYKYHLPAGTYTLTENTSLPTIIDGQELHTSSVSVNGQPGNTATFTIKEGETTSVAFMNSLGEVAVKFPTITGGAYSDNATEDTTDDTITLIKGMPFSITAELSNGMTEGVTWKWTLTDGTSSMGLGMNPSDTSYSGNPCTGTATDDMHGKYLTCEATWRSETFQTTVQLIVEEPAAPAGSSSSSVPKTGDATPLALLACMAILSLTGLYFIKRRSA